MTTKEFTIRKAGGRVIDGSVRCPVHGYEIDLETGASGGNDLNLEVLKVHEGDSPP